MTEIEWYPLEGVPDGEQSFAATVADVRLLLVRSPDGWWAVEDRCSHARCAFSEDGEIDGGVVICDCHGAEFDLSTGAVLRAPATEPIRTFPVRSADGLNLEVGL